MANPDLFKKRIQKILSQKYSIEYLGKNFDKIVLLINDNLEERIFSWIKKVVKKQLYPISAETEKKYKSWNTRNLLTFRFPFNMNGVEYRIILVKVKNSVYIEFHLGKHKYYDSVRKEIGIS